MCSVTDLLNLGAGEAERSEIPEDQVVLRSIRLKSVVVFEQHFGHSSGVDSDLLGVGLESGIGGLLQGDGDTSNGLKVGLQRGAVGGMSRTLTLL